MLCPNLRRGCPRILRNGLYFQVLHSLVLQPDGGADDDLPQEYRDNEEGCSDRPGFSARILLQLAHLGDRLSMGPVEPAPEAGDDQDHQRYQDNYARYQKESAHTLPFRIKVYSNRHLQAHFYRCRLPLEVFPGPCAFLHTVRLQKNFRAKPEPSVREEPASEALAFRTDHRVSRKRQDAHLTGTLTASPLSELGSGRKARRSLSGGSGGSR